MARASARAARCRRTRSRVSRFRRSARLSPGVTSEGLRARSQSIARYIGVTARKPGNGLQREGCQNPGSKLKRSFETPQAPQIAAAAAAPAPAPQGKADFALSVQKSYCFENPSSAYIYCNIWIRNTGNADGGNPAVYVFLDYSDGGSAIVDNISEALNDASTAYSGSIPAHSSALILIRHTYNAVGHDLIRAAATLDMNADSAPYIRVCTSGSCQGRRAPSPPSGRRGSGDAALRRADAAAHDGFRRLQTSILAAPRPDTSVRV